MVKENGQAILKCVGTLEYKPYEPEFNQSDNKKLKELLKDGWKIKSISSGSELQKTFCYIWLEKEKMLVSEDVVTNKCS